MCSPVNFIDNVQFVQSMLIILVLLSFLNIKDVIIINIISLNITTLSCNTRCPVIGDQAENKRFLVVR